MRETQFAEMWVRYGRDARKLASEIFKISLQKEEMKIIGNIACICDRLRGGCSLVLDYALLSPMEVQLDLTEANRLPIASTRAE